jgi:hypothetical protein
MKVNLKVNDKPKDKTGTDSDMVLPERCNTILLWRYFKTPFNT